MHLQTGDDISHHTVQRLCLIIVKVALMLLVRPMQRTGLEGLEPHAVKVARVVLRGLGGGDLARLPGAQAVRIAIL